MKSSFLENVNNFKYCSVDLDVLYNYNPSWRQFMEDKWTREEDITSNPRNMAWRQRQRMEETISEKKKKK
jgi:hypothetical protein